MNIQIHATNIEGLGAVNVVQNLLSELLPSLSKEYNNVFLYKSENININFRVPDNIHIIIYKRFLPKALSRFLELYFSKLFFQNISTITLGDIPLRKIKNQILLIHQSNFISPSINPYSSKSLSFKVQRFLLRNNLKYTRHIIVQSDIMKNGLMKSYKISDNVISVQPNPVNCKYCYNKITNSNINTNKLILFYPSSYYPHKNHKLLFQLDSDNKCLSLIEKIILTINKKEMPSQISQKYLALGRLNIDECINKYKHSSALIFPSFMESYGLPLVEAMFLDLPILVSKLPYAEWLCGDQAIYFDPESINSLKNAICSLYEKINDGWKPDYSNQLEKIPLNWKIFSDVFIQSLGK